MFATDGWHCEQSGYTCIRILPYCSNNCDGCPIPPSWMLHVVTFFACRTCPICRGFVVKDAYYGPDLNDSGQQLYAADAVECCVACLLRASCAAWLLLESPNATLHKCTLRSSVDYIILKDASYPGSTVYSGARNNTRTPQFPPPPPGGLPVPR